MKSFYVQPSVTVTELDLESCILDGSLTSKPIMVQDVTVEDYVNGFGANAFEEINFD